MHELYEKIERPTLPRHQHILLYDVLVAVPSLRAEAHKIAHRLDDDLVKAVAKDDEREEAVDSLVSYDSEMDLILSYTDNEIRLEIVRDLLKHLDQCRNGNERHAWWYGEESD